MEKEVLEVVLKNAERESNIKRIIDIKWEAALPKGENYTSNVLRVKAKVILGNGRVVNKSFIAKKEKAGEATDQFSKDYEVFKKEASVYIDIFREMEYMMEEFGDTEGPLWCELIHFNQADGIIILEDLKSLGFSTVNRRELQDLDHAKLSLRSLGKYHAMAKVLETRGLISKDDYKPFFLTYNETYIRNIIYSGIRALVKGMRASWGKDWAEAADKLDQMTFEELSKRIQESVKFDDDTFKCLNHGDCWSNNIMFKHNWEGRPIDIRFVDFQFPHYNTPCLDVIYFLYSSIQSKIRRQNYKILTQVYHESLISNLDRFGYEGPKPSLEDIQKLLERLSFYGLTFFMGFLPTVYTETTNAVDFDEIFESNGESGYNISIFSESGLIEKLGEDVKELVKLQES